MERARNSRRDFEERRTAYIEALGAGHFYDLAMWHQGERATLENEKERAFLYLVHTVDVIGSEEVVRALNEWLKAISDVRGSVLVRDEGRKEFVRVIRVELHGESLFRFWLTLLGFSGRR